MALSASWFEDRTREIGASLAFCTRLPLLNDTPTGSSAIGRAAWAFPIAGIAVGLIGALVYGIAHWQGLPALPSAALSVVATLLATGCLHEDGLADTADGFGGGKTRERKLEIMRDSRIGTYGVCALVLSLLLRVGALASFPNAHLAVWALIAAHGGARATMPALMFLLPPARSDGLSFSAGAPSGQSVGVAALIGFVILAICLHPVRGAVTIVYLAIIVALIAWLSSRQIGGQTGDVCGALEQVSEIAILLVALG
jgi:adenosylcobinamide-GDP ribazoletransferase